MDDPTPAAIFDVGEAERIEHTDERYAALHALWVRNGRPWQFDREDRSGGAIYHAIVTDERYPDQPTFFIHASAGPTVYPENDQQGLGPLEKGWAWLVRRRGYLRFRRAGPGPAHNARLVIRKIPLPRQ